MPLGTAFSSTTATTRDSTILEFVPSSETGMPNPYNVYTTLWSAGDTQGLPGIAPNAGFITERERMSLSPETMPSNQFVRVYYGALAILGLFVLFRLLQKQ